jgi:hypothetical protein
MPSPSTSPLRGYAQDKLRAAGAESRQAHATGPPLDSGSLTLAYARDERIDRGSCTVV